MTNTSIEATKLTRSDLIAMLEAMVVNMESLPPVALYSPVNHYDLLSALRLIFQILKEPA